MDPSARAAARTAHRALGSGPAPRVRTPRRVGAVDRDLGARAPRSRDGEGARGARPALAAVDRRHHPPRTLTGEFPDGEDADELGLELGAMIDGLAIQVLMNDTAFTPTRMYEVCMDVSARLIGFDLVHGFLTLPSPAEPPGADCPHGCFRPLDAHGPAHATHLPPGPLAQRRGGRARTLARLDPGGVLATTGTPVRRRRRPTSPSPSHRSPVSSRWRSGRSTSTSQGPQALPRHVHEGERHRRRLPHGDQRQPGLLRTLVPLFESGQATNWDITALSDWVVNLMRQQGWLETLDWSALPTADERCSTRSATRRMTPGTRTACRGRAASPASPTTPTSCPAARSRPSPTCGTRSSRATWGC